MFIQEGLTGFSGRWLQADNDEFQPRRKLESQVELENEESHGVNDSNTRKASSWIQENLESWNAMIVREEQGSKDHHVLILKIPIFPTNNKDQWAWTYTSSRELSVRLAYWRCKESMQHNIDPFWNCIWKAKLHERHKMMIWRIATSCLPTKDKLSRFVDIGDVYCPLYRLETKTSLHLFALCPIAKVVWFSSKWGLRMDSFGFSSEVDFIQFLCSPLFTNQLS